MRPGSVEQLPKRVPPVTSPACSLEGCSQLRDPIPVETWPWAHVVPPSLVLFYPCLAKENQGISLKVLQWTTRIEASLHAPFLFSSVLLMPFLQILSSERLSWFPCPRGHPIWCQEAPWVWHVVGTISTTSGKSLSQRCLNNPRLLLIQARC